MHEVNQKHQLALKQKEMSEIALLKQQKLREKQL